MMLKTNDAEMIESDVKKMQANIRSLTRRLAKNSNYKLATEWVDAMMAM